MWTRRGLQRFIVLFFIELSTRKVKIAGISSAANGLWMSQNGGNVTDAVEGILHGKRYLTPRGIGQAAPFPEPGDHPPSYRKPDYRETHQKGM